MHRRIIAVLADTSRFSVLMAIIAGLAGAFGLAGVLLGYDFPGQIGSKVVPIAPSSAVCIVLLAVSMILLNLLNNPGLKRLLPAAFAAFVGGLSSLAILDFLFHLPWDVEKTLFPYDRTVGGIELAHMSPLGGICYAVLSVCILMLVVPRRTETWSTQISAVSGIGVLVVGFVGTLGYAYDAPLLYGSSVRPLAMIAALALMFLGLSLAGATGSGRWPMRKFVGSSVRARLLRTFLPTVIVLVLVTNWAAVKFTEESRNPAILSSVLALASASLALIAVARLSGVIGGQVDESSRRLVIAQNELESANRQLEQRSDELAALNRDLEAFNYSVSHDLRGPLLAIDGYSYTLGQKLSLESEKSMREDIEKIRAASHRMAALIEDLLQFSRASKGGFEEKDVDLGKIADEVFSRLRAENPGREVIFVNKVAGTARCDARLMEVALQNLLGNSWKFTSKTPEPVIEFGAKRIGDTTVYFVKDNGAGFDQGSADKLFTPFQRLHKNTEFPGTGIGLATVSRIIARQKGEVWAEGAVDKGATFYFTLGGPRPRSSD